MLERCIRYAVYATFFIPLIVGQKSFIFPFIVPKILLFRSLVLFMLGCYILLLYGNWKMYRPRLTPHTIAILLFLGSFTISTIVGVDPYRSFWDNHERMLGLFTIIHYVIYFFICSAVFRTWADWRRALQVFLFAGSIVMVIGLIQIINPFYLLNNGSPRVASTLGNSIYVGGYGLFLIFTSILLFLKEQVKAYKWIYVMVVILSLGGVIASGSRGAVLGVLGGLVSSIVIYLVFGKENRKGRMIAASILGIGVLLSAVLFVNRESAFVAKVPVLSRLLNTSIASIMDSPRFVAWKIAYQGWKDYPVFGWGPNNYFYAFNKNYDPSLLNHGYGETWFDNAHNIVMNTLTVQGLFGVISYIALFVVAIGGAYRAYRKKYIDLALLMGGSGFLIAHLTQNLTVFENPTSYLYFMFWLALMHRLTTESVLQESVSRRITTTPLVVVSVCTALFILIFNIQPARANHQTLNAIRAIYENRPERITLMQEALKMETPHIDDIRNDLARAAGQVVLGNNGQNLNQVKEFKDLLFLSIDALKQNLQLHPLDIRTHLSLAQLLQAAALSEQNGKYIVETEQYLTQALALSPERQQIRYGLASTKLQLGKDQEAIALLEETLARNERIAESYWRLAYAYGLIGQKEKALEVLGRAEENNIPFTQDELRIVNGIKTMEPGFPPGVTTSSKKK